jgi:hypothetical protein
MKVDGVGAGFRRRSRAEVVRLVSEYERSRQFRVVLACGLCIEVEPGFDAAELRRLIAALDGAPLRNGLRQPV